MMIIFSQKKLFKSNYIIVTKFGNIYFDLNSNVNILLMKSILKY